MMNLGWRSSFEAFIRMRSRRPLFVQKTPKDVEEASIQGRCLNISTKRSPIIPRSCSRALRNRVNMSTPPESPERLVTAPPTDIATLGAQLSETLNKFDELSREMATQRRMIDQLVASSSDAQSKPLLASQPTYSYPYPFNPCPVYHTNINHPRPRLPYNPRPFQPNNRTHHLNRKIRSPTPYRTFTNLGRPIDQLYEQLKAAGKIDTIPPKIYLKGFPHDYDPQAVCAYHSGTVGHSTNDCRALKHKIQDMIDAGDIVFRKREEREPSTSANPFPEHKDTNEEI